MKTPEEILKEAEEFADEIYGIDQAEVVSSMITRLVALCRKRGEALQRGHAKECHIIQGDGLGCSCGKWDNDNAALAFTGEGGES